MSRSYLALALVVLVASASAFPAQAAPYFANGSSVLVATSTTANAYAAGGTVTVTSSVAGDLAALGGSVIVDAAIGGDLLATGGSLQVAGPIAGDARLMGGQVTVTDPVGNDLVVIAGSFTDSGSRARSTTVLAGDVTFSGGGGGAITVYANSVSLAGTFSGNVDVFVAGQLVLDENTHIRGALNYQAPQEATIPESAIIDGGVHYTGASYLPTSEEARAIALASFGVFLFVKILGALILAGLFAGLFPSLAERVARRALKTNARRTFLSLLLGFGILIATPVFLFFLAVTFVGLGLAFIVGLGYLLLLMLAFVYAGVVSGAYLARHLFKREDLRWSDAVLGMFVLFLLWSLPLIGWTIVMLGVIYMIGILTHLAFRFAFPRDALHEFEG